MRQVTADCGGDFLTAYIRLDTGMYFYFYLNFPPPSQRRVFEDVFMFKSRGRLEGTYVAACLFIQSTAEQDIILINAQLRPKDGMESS